MSVNFDKVLITGGAGFIGSHLTDRLVLDGNDVTVLDNFSTGKNENLILSSNKKNFKLIKRDLNKSIESGEFLKDIKTVFHLAAHPEVRTGFENPEIAYRENIENTYLLLEKIRKSNVKTLIFSSSSVVYGEPGQIPTPEKYGPLLPISLMGGSKLACEGLISAYCQNYGIKGIMIRFANIIGSRSEHGVIWDFIKKLRKDKEILEILGNGTQTKSYLHIQDCIEGFIVAAVHSKDKVEIFNIGNEDQVDVTTIAKIVVDKMNLKSVKIITKGGTNDGRGWVGDVKNMHLDISKLKDVGWKPKLLSDDAVKLATEETIRDLAKN